MANQTPQLQEEHPVIAAQNISSGAESYDAFAKTLGAIAGAAEEKVIQIESDKSQTMYINSVANIEQLKTTAQMRLLEHPDQADKIAEQNTQAMELVKQAAFVNKQDRAKLNAYISGADDDVLLRATQTRVRQNQNEAAYTHFVNWGDQLKAYQQALMTNPEQAKDLHDAMIASLNGLVKTGALTPTQAASSMKVMEGVVDAVHDLHRAGYGGDVTAKDYHTLTSSPLSQNLDTTHAPVNASTGWMVNHYNEDKSFQGVLSDIQNKVRPDAQTFVSLTKTQREHAIQAINGVRVADGLINSGESFPVIEKHLESLNEKGRVLSYKEQATRNSLSLYVNELKNGNYLKVMASTPMGNAIMQDFNVRNKAIQSMNIDVVEKNKLLMQNKNKLVNESISYAEGHHIPSDYVQPIPLADIANVEQGFQLGKDPSSVIQTLGQYTKSNQAYLANAMKNPNQRMVVSAVSLLGANIPPNEQLDFIAANQTGRTDVFKNIEDATKDKTLMTRISTNLAPSLKMLANNYDFENAQVLQNSMLNTTLKYAKYLAQKDNNIGALDKSGFILSADSWKQYVDKASKIYQDAYKKMSGTNWIVNPNQLPQPLTSTELDVLADHVTNEGYKYLKMGRNEGEYQSAIGRNPLRMIITPKNDVQAVDGNGKVYYTMPFTTNILPYVQESKKRREADKRAAILKAIENQEKRMLNVRLPEDAEQNQ